MLSLTPIMTRLLYASVILMLGFTDWLLKYFNPESNAGNWLAAAAGAFLLRFAIRGLPIQASVTGWLAGFMIACLFAPDVLAAGGILWLKRPEANFGIVAFLGDLVIQLVAFGIRLSTKVGGTIYDDPSGAFDGTLDRVEKVTSVWARIKTPLLDLVSTIFSKKP